MQLSEQKDGEHVRTSRAQKNGSSDFPRFQLVLFLHQRDGVMMDGGRDLVTQSSGELLGVLHKVKQRIDNINVAAGSCEGVRLRFVNQVKLERVVVARLRSLRNGVGNRLQPVVQRGRFDDFALRLEFVEDLLAHL